MWGRGGRLQSCVGHTDCGGRGGGGTRQVVEGMEGGYKERENACAELQVAPVGF